MGAKPVSGMTASEPRCGRSRPDLQAEIRRKQAKMVLRIRAGAWLSPLFAFRSFVGSLPFSRALASPLLCPARRCGEGVALLEIGVGMHPA